MSKIESSPLNIDQWVKVRMEQLARIDSRISKNLEKYRQRKSNSMDSSGEMYEGRNSVERESVELECDQIADDWRKLRDTITSEIPNYIHKNTKAKTINKANTVRQEAERVAKKIEARVQQADLQDYRYKQGLKKWETNIKVSKLREPTKKEEPEYEEIDSQEKPIKGSLILEDINSIGRDNLKKIEKVVSENEKIVGDYEQEKKQDKVSLIVMIGLLPVLATLILWVDVHLPTKLHRYFFDFFQP